jgi:hypothetical protein
MPRHLYIPEIETLLWFPDDPHFGQWMSRPEPRSYGIPFYGKSPTDNHGIENAGVIGTILVNWSSKPSQYGFDLIMSPAHNSKNFHHSPEFKHMKSRMDGIAMKAGKLVIDRDSDLLVFRMLYGEQLPS